MPCFLIGMMSCWFINLQSTQFDYIVLQELNNASLAVGWGMSHTYKLSALSQFCGHQNTKKARPFVFSLLLHHQHVTCLPGQSYPVLSSLSLLLESCLNKVTFIHEWVSMATRPQDYLSHSPPWCDG